MRFLGRLFGRRNKYLETQGKGKFSDSLKHAIDGILYVERFERNFRFELFFGMFVLIAGVFFGVSAVEWCVLVLTVSLILALEMVNTAIERCVDLVTLEYKELARIAKDVAAGAVLIASCLSVAIGIIIFLPKIIIFIK